MVKKKIDSKRVVLEEGISPEGYTAEEWADLSDKEKEGVLMGIPDLGEEEPGDGGNHGSKS